MPDPSLDAVRVFIDVRDPRVRRLLRDALAADRHVRFVSARRSADVVLGDVDTPADTTRAIGAVAGDDRESPLDSPGGARGALTAREREVLQLLAEGASNDAMATQLGISRSTVKFHLHALFEKLGVHRRAEAVTAGIRRGEVLL